MLDGLRSEFPEGAALARRVGPGVARAPLPWSLLAAFGAGFFVRAFVIVLFSVLFRIFSVPSDAPIPRPFELARIAELGIAFAVAYVAGGRPALTAYAAILVVEGLVNLANHGRFCGEITPAPPSCSFFGFWLAQWPIVFGIAVGYGLVRRLAVSEGGGNPVLEAAGGLALTQSFLGTIFSLLFRSTSDLETGLLTIVGAVAAGVVCGLVLLTRVPVAQQWRVLGIVALGLAVPWLAVTLPAFLEQSGVGGGIAISGLVVLGAFYPILQIGGAALLLYMAAARRVTAA